MSNTETPDQGSLRRWWPLDWVDEVSPPPRFTPDEWLIDADGHYYLGYQLDAADVSEHEKRYFCRALDEAPVEFFYQDDLGVVDVAIAPDGTVAVNSEVPTDANWFWQGDYEACGDTLDEVIRQIRETERIDSGGVEVVVNMLRQGTQHYRLQLEYLPKMRAYLVPVDAALAKQ